MNTQRPEWNDANNALAGFGLSMVTACQLRRHHGVAASSRAHRGSSVLRRDRRLARIHHRGPETERGLLEADRIDDHGRRRVMDALGRAFERRRHETFGRPTVPVSVDAIRSFIDHALAWLDHAIAANARGDGLHHGYNLLQLGDDTASIRRLPEMLEGQVAVLSSGVLSHEAADLVEALRFRPSSSRSGHLPASTRSEIPSFSRRAWFRSIGSTICRCPRTRRRRRSQTGRSRWRRDDASRAPWSTDAMSTACSTRSPPRRPGPMGQGPAGRRAGDLRSHLRSPRLHRAIRRDVRYEGIGCTYWHMVAKLLVAVGECASRPRRTTRLRRRSSGWSAATDGSGTGCSAWTPRRSSPADRRLLPQQRRRPGPTAR